MFAHTSGLENALSLKCTESEPFILSTQTAPITNIVNRKKAAINCNILKFSWSIVFLFLGWCENYNDNIVDGKELQSEIDTYMSEYDKTSAARIQTEKDTVDNEDEDGWKTVSKKYLFIFVILRHIIIVILLTNGKLQNVNSNTIV